MAAEFGDVFNRLTSDLSKKTSVFFKSYGTEGASLRELQSETLYAL